MRSWLLAIAFIALGCRKSNATAADAGAAAVLGPPAPDAAAVLDHAPRTPTSTGPFRARDLLFEMRLPPGWNGDADGDLAAIGDARGKLAAHVTLVPAKKLGDILHAPTKAGGRAYVERPEARTVDGHKAALVRVEDPESEVLYVENRLGQLLAFTFLVRSETDLDDLIATIRLLEPLPPAPKVDVYGTVMLREGGCMPPNPPCTVRPVSRAIELRPSPSPALEEAMRLRKPTRDGRTVLSNRARVIAATRSGADGSYRVSVPPGNYLVLALPEDGTAQKGRAAEAVSTVSAVDRPAQVDVIINHAID